MKLSNIFYVIYSYIYAITNLFSMFLLIYIYIYVWAVHYMWPSLYVACKCYTHGEAQVALLINLCLKKYVSEFFSYSLELHNLNYMNLFFLILKLVAWSEISYVLLYISRQIIVLFIYPKYINNHVITIYPFIIPIFGNIFDCISKYYAFLLFNVAHYRFLKFYCKLLIQRFVTTLMISLLYSILSYFLNLFMIQLKASLIELEKWHIYLATFADTVSNRQNSCIIILFVYAYNTDVAYKYSLYAM